MIDKHRPATTSWKHPSNPKAKVLRFMLMFILMQSTLLFAAQSTPPTIDEIIRDIVKNSDQLSANLLDLQATQSSNEKQRLIFKNTGSLSSTYKYQKNSPAFDTTPRSDSWTLNGEVAIEKLWPVGVQSRLSYGIAAEPGQPFAADQRDILTPKIEASVSSKIFQDLVGSRYSKLVEELDTNDEALNDENIVQKQKLITSSLLKLASLLETESNISLQDKLCRESSKQSRKLAKKRKLQTVSKRDYLLSMKDLNNCEITVEELKRDYKEGLDVFRTTYNLDKNKYKSLNIDDFFESLSTTALKINSKDTDRKHQKDSVETQSLASQLESARHRQAQLNALTRSDLALNLKVGALGSDADLGEAHQELLKLKSPYITVGMQMNFPMENRSNVLDASTNQLRVRSLEKRLALARAQYWGRAETLSKTLLADFKIYKKYKKSTILARRIYTEAKRDFANGRIDFFALAEFSKSAIQSQKSFSNNRTVFIVKLIDYLSLQNFFAKYL